MRALRLSLAALALAAPLAAPAGARAIAAAPAESDLERLVALLLPDSASAELATRAFDYALDQGIIGDSASKALYGRYPGLRAHVAEALRPQIRKLIGRELPALRKQMGAALASELTPQEITDTANFFASPTGRKVQASVFRSMGEKPGRKEGEVQQAAMSAVMASLAPEDYPAMIAFAAGSAASKLNAINPKLAAASKAWADRLVRENGPKMGKLAARATKKFVRRAEREKRT